jgi:hypothetical protein
VPTIGVSDPGGSLDRRVKLLLRAPAQMGWRGMEHKRWDKPCIILHQGAHSRGYKRREREEESWSVSPSSPLRESPLSPFSFPPFSPSAGRPWTSLL